MKEIDQPIPNENDLLTTSSLVGGLEGALIGLGGAYLARKAGISVEHLGLYLAGGGLVIGATVRGVLANLKNTSKDRHPRKLILDQVKATESAEISLQRGERFRGIAELVESVTNGIQNKNLAKLIYSGAVRSLSKDPFEDSDLRRGMRSTYHGMRGSIIANYMGVFDPFEYDGKQIDPKASLDDFFSTALTIYRYMGNGLSRALGKLSGKSNNSPDKDEDIDWTKNMALLLDRETRNATDISLWANYLSHKDGAVGDRINAKLDQLGITHPQNLPSDIEIIRSNIQGIYDRWKNKREVPYGEDIE